MEQDYMARNAELARRVQELELEVAALRARIASSGAVAAPHLAAPAAAAPADTAALQAEAVAARAMQQREEQRGECSFFFVSADYVRGTTLISLPSFQELQRIDGALIKRTLAVTEAYHGSYAKHLLAVSHRWERMTEPDIEGVQLRAIQAYLRKNPQIEGVWYECALQCHSNPAPRQNLEL